MSALYKKLILISLDWTRPKDPALSLGHASILAYLRHTQVSVIERSWSVNKPNFCKDKVVDFILNNAALDTDVAFGVFVWNEKYIQFILNSLKRSCFQGRIILGGPQISYVRSGLEQYYPQADVFIRGYGESALSELMLSPKSNPPIQGVHYANHRDLGLSANPDFEALPSPYLSNIIKAQPFLRWETKRGCPFKCSFCQHREPNATMKRQSLSSNRIKNEIKWISEHEIINDIAVLDPVFNAGKDYLATLSALADIGYSGKLSLQCRTEMITDEFLDLVEAINKTGHIVLELGLQTIHKNEQKIIRRMNNMPIINRMLENIKSRGIDIEVSLIFGLPSQTVKSFKENIDFCKKFEIPRIYAYPLMLLRGTPLYYQKEQLGLIESSSITLKHDSRLFNDIPHVISSPTFSYSEWQEMKELSEDLHLYNEEHNATA